jgi:hypothetical protein
VIRKNANDKNGQGQIKTTTMGGETVSEGHNEGNGESGTWGRGADNNNETGMTTRKAPPQNPNAVSVSFLFLFLFRLLATNCETYQVLIR